MGNVDQNIKIPLSSYYNLTTSTSNSKIITGNISVLGNVLIAAGSVLEFNNSNITITVGGNWIHETGATLNELYGEVIFSGNNNQVIDGNPNETFYNLTINKPSGTVRPIDNSTNITVSNNFNLTEVHLKPMQTLLTLQIIQQ